ncbi:Magnesium and cobalt efflux protein CorC [Leucobacter sp. 7(1)]|uniref:hemolysin family protein n=1 Tax=Leucobacter sp. 7(1) TaxID=1255613 RepID=UPI00097E9203|nr:hemolysin family protein [Leucobacter sp. 7(1)]SJN12749.1 Magnesium and cobalt efflux protein CorC [Leucobacter sp. 7(1)]
MSSELWGILAGVVLTVGTGFFVASEFALVNLDRSELERRRSRGEKGLGPTISALRVTSTHLSSAQLGITLTTLLAGFTFEPAISALLRAPLESIGLPAGLVPGVGTVVAIVLATLFSMIIGELMPKNFALAVPLATAKFVVPFQLAFTFIFKPVILFFNGTANRVIRSFGIEPKEELSAARSAEELGYLIRRSATEGSLDLDDASMLERTLRFSTHTADAVMTPRVDVVTLPGTASAEDVIAAAQRSGHSRFPILGTGIDDVIGIAHVKTAYGVDFDRRADTPVTSLTTAPLRVPETAGVGSLLGTLRGRGYQIAVVVDEHGGTAGIVTLEDLVEELLGELLDEHDDPAEFATDVIFEPESVLFSAGLRPDELHARAAIDVPESAEYETVAGFVLHSLGRVPELGEEVPLDNGKLRIERLDGARIEQLRYLPATPHTDPGTAGEVRTPSTTEPQERTR